MKNLLYILLLCIFIKKIISNLKKMNESKYIQKVSSYLENFKDLNGKFTFKCNICGDSKTRKYLTRAWFTERDSYIFHCFNCNITMSFSNYLKEYFPDIYREYILEKLRDRSFNSVEYKEKKVTSKDSDYIKSLLRKCTEHKDVISYLESRRIPEKMYNDIYVIENFKNLCKIEKYKDSNFSEEKRIIMNCYDSYGNISGIIARALDRNAKKRYINLKVDDSNALIFGLYDYKGNYKINLNKVLYVVEGAIDSLFIDNCISVNTSDLLIIDKVLSKKFIDSLNIVYVPDNESRNSEVLKVYKKIIKANKKIVIMPYDIKQKDINEIILNNNINILELLNNNTYQGLKAENKFLQFKKV